MAQSVKRERTFADLISKGVNPMYHGISALKQMLAITVKEFRVTLASAEVPDVITIFACVCFAK